MKIGGHLRVEGTAMLGPGEYVPDVTEGIPSVEDLPKPRIEHRSRNYKARRCPRCGLRAGPSCRFRCWTIRQGGVRTCVAKALAWISRVSWLAFVTKSPWV